MENDPNKKESRGKRLIKKAIRRSSKSSNNSQNSSLEQSIGVTRSKSENKRLPVKINDSAPLPTPDGPSDRPEHSDPGQNGKIAGKAAPESLAPPRRDPRDRKIVDIQEERNEVYQEAATASKKDTKKIFKIDENEEATSSRRGVKRKLEEESGAGTSGASTGASDTDADDKDPSKDKKKKNRCAVCRKKVGLTGFECRCGGLFCALHRYSDKHECSFDYRELGAQEIRRNNPVVVSQKIHKI